MPSLRLRSRRRLLAGALTIAASLLVAGPASAAQTLGLNLTTTHFDFTGFACVNPLETFPACSLFAVTTDGTARSNLAGPGTVHGDLIVDFSPGGTCNIVDETETFTFAAASITVHSNHEDCKVVGLRIQTTFVVTGGTGIYAGASGGGTEIAPALSPDVVAGKGTNVQRQTPVVYNGTISY